MDQHAHVAHVGPDDVSSFYARRVDGIHGKPCGAKKHDNDAGMMIVHGG